MLKNDAGNKSVGTQEYSCTTTYDSDGMQISRQWYQLFEFIGIVLAAVVFNAVWISNDFLGILTSDRALLLKMFALLFIFIGLGSVYFSLALWLNKTVISVSHESIQVGHGPVPWPGATTIDRSRVTKLVVEAKHHLGSSMQKPKVTQRLYAHTAESEPLKVLTGLKYRRQALHIKQEMDAYLGFENEAEPT